MTKQKLTPEELIQTKKTLSILRENDCLQGRVELYKSRNKHIGFIIKFEEKAINHIIISIPQFNYLLKKGFIQTSPDASSSTNYIFVLSSL